MTLIYKIQRLSDKWDYRYLNTNVYSTHKHIKIYIFSSCFEKKKICDFYMCWETYGQCHDIRIKHHVYDAAKLIILELIASTSSFSSERHSVTKTWLITENKLHVYIYNYI